MDQVPKGAIQIFYNGVNITADISRHLVSFTYADKTEDESDELIIELEDTEALWRNEWYPEKGAKIFARIGATDDALFDCGHFILDQIDLMGPPDTVTLRCLAAVFAKNLRTKKGSSHSKKTLLQIAQYVATNNGFNIVGTIPNIPIDRATQHRETDLHWLRRLSREYGIVFSLRGKDLIFTSIYDLEAAKAVYDIKRTEMIRWKLSDKISGTYSSAQVKYQNPYSNTVIDTIYKIEKATNADGIVFDQIVKDDTLIIRTKTENQTQAKEKARAALHHANSKQKEGTVRVIGNPLFVSGNNINLLDMGSLSGKYHVLRSSHDFTKQGGYTTDMDVKLVGTTPVKSNKIKPKRAAKKVKATAPPATAKQSGDGITIYADLNTGIHRPTKTLF